MIRDLRRMPPRRWSEELGGIRWLPRLVDKARAARAGTLGDYLFGQSPMDRALLRRLGLRHRELYELVGRPNDDAAVGAALRERVAEGVEEARRWSAELPRRHRLFLWLIDVDDGYLPGPLRLFKTPANALSAALTRTLKRVQPRRY